MKFLSDDKFKPIQNTLDALMKQGARDGLGLNKRQAAIITEEMEDELWAQGLLGDSNPRTLLNTVVYVLGLHFALRGRDEHRRLRNKPSQLTVQMGKDGRRYVQYQEVCLTAK